MYHFQKKIFQLRAYVLMVVISSVGPLALRELIIFQRGQLITGFP